MNDFNEFSGSAVQAKQPKIAVENLARHYADKIIPLLHQAFDETDDALFNRANNARNNNEQNRCFEAMREIRLKRKSIEASIRSGLLNAFNAESVCNIALSPKRATNENLSLVNQEELEEQLALDTMIAKANSRLKEVSLTLTPRVSALYSVNDSDFNNPFDPSVLFTLFSEASSSLEIDIHELLLFYKQIDKSVIPFYSNVLEAMNQKLIDEGVLSDLTPMDVRTRSLNKDAPALDELKQLVSSDEQTKTVRNTAHSDAEKNSTKGEASGTNQITKTYSTANYEELVSALNLLSSDLDSTKQTIRLSDPQVQSDLQTLLHSSFGESKSLGSDDLDLINLVALLFEYILEDQTLSPKMQVLIGRLQIPVLKVVLNNPEFFNSQFHPARRFLDRLASAALGWTDSANEHNGRYYEALKTLVLRIVDEVDSNKDIFHECDISLEEFLKYENHRREIIAQRTKRTEEGRIKSRVAQDFVDNTIYDLIASCSPELPESVQRLLNGPWRRVLFLAFLKDSQEHRWEATRKVTEELVWCSNNYQNEKDRQRWIGTVPKLLKQISNELNNISFSTQETQQLIEELRSSLAKRFRESSLSNTNDSKEISSQQSPKHRTASITNSDASGAIQFQKEMTSSYNEKHLELASKLEVGQWLKVQIDGITHRYKISAIIDEVNSLVLIDRLGTNTIEKTKQEVAAGLCHNEITILEKGSLVDRALSHMMDNFHHK